MKLFKYAVALLCLAAVALGANSCLPHDDMDDIDNMDYMFTISAEVNPYNPSDYSVDLKMITTAYKASMQAIPGYKEYKSGGFMIEGKTLNQAIPEVQKACASAESYGFDALMRGCMVIVHAEYTASNGIQNYIYIHQFASAM